MDDNENKKSNEALNDETQTDETQTGEALPDAEMDAVAGGAIQIPKFVIPDYV